MSPTSGTSPREGHRSVLSNRDQTLSLSRVRFRRSHRFCRISQDFSLAGGLKFILRLPRRRAAKTSKQLDDVLGHERNAAVSQPLGDRHAIPRRMTSVLKASRLLRIFVVEDHPDTLQALCLYLKYVGHTVRSARTKEEALKKIPAGR